MFAKYTKFYVPRENYPLLTWRLIFTNNFKYYAYKTF